MMEAVSPSKTLVTAQNPRRQLSLGSVKFLVCGGGVNLLGESIITIMTNAGLSDASKKAGEATNVFTLWTGVKLAKEKKDDERSERRLRKVA
jgi:hypothetical protein